MHHNSRYSYGYINGSGVRVTQESMLLRVIQKRKKGLTRHELSTLTGIPLHVISARVHSLIEQKLVIEDGSKINAQTQMPNAIVRAA